MKYPRGFGAWLLPWAGAAVLMIALSGISRPGLARTYEPQPGPNPEGDPTADDQPSPSPKSNGKFAAPALRDGRSAAVRSTRSMGRLIWLSYVRAWIRIAAR